MTYSFFPLADIPVAHDGMFIVCMACFGIFWLTVCTEGFRTACVVFVVMMMPILGIAYGVSFHWTDQTPQTFKNEKVVGTFVGYESEGYKERSGKSYVDRHFTYIVYKVDGGNVMLPCKTGVVYPENVVLYKN